MLLHALIELLQDAHIKPNELICLESVAGVGVDLSYAGLSQARWSSLYRSIEAAGLLKDYGVWLQATPNVAFARRDYEAIWAPAFAFEAAMDPAITDIVNVGIGGSDLGSRLMGGVVTGVRRLHHIANLDPAEAQAVLADLNPETTLAVVVSKSFGTHETMVNGERVRSWLGQYAKAHMLAVTSNQQAAVDLGFLKAHIFSIPDYVGGRYSWCTPATLAVLLAYGPAVVRGFLSGGHAMDLHALQAPANQHLPLHLALLSVFYQNVWGAQTQAIIPYAHRLSSLPAYLQQLMMESLGKRVTQAGQVVQWQTGPVIWGGVATNAQHAFHQLLMQGTLPVPVDFVLPLAQPGAGESEQHAVVVQANAQRDALMFGTDADVAPEKMITPNHPSTLLTLNALSPETVGALIALYEHRTILLGRLWDINVFDQWGVERGKVLARLA